MKKKLNKYYNQKKFSFMDFSVFFSGELDEKNYYKIKSNHKLSKLDLKLFFFDVYQKNFNTVHSRREFKKNKKVFWVKTSDRKE